MRRIVVVENRPMDGLRQFAGWLAEAGAEISVVSPHVGMPLPKDPEAFDGVIVLGGPQDSFDAPDGTPGAPWFPELRTLIRAAVVRQVPYLGICLGAQLLAVACGGTVARARSGPEMGAYELSVRPVSGSDALLAAVPDGAYAMQWHQDEIVALPPGSVWLASSAQIRHQAFRLGPQAWGVQFHPEMDEDRMVLCGKAAVESWPELWSDPDAVIEPALRRKDEMFAVWRAFAHRFAALT